MYIISNLWANFSNWWWPTEPTAVCENILERLSNNQLETPNFIKPAACLIEDVYREHGTAAAICTASAISLGIYKGGGFHYLYNRLKSTSSDDFIHAVHVILKEQYGTKYDKFLTSLQDAINQCLPEAIEKQRQRDKDQATADSTHQTGKLQFAAASNPSDMKAEADSNLRNQFINKTVLYIRTLGDGFTNASPERKQQIVEGIKDWYLQDKLPANTNDEVTPVASSSSRCIGA